MSYKKLNTQYIYAKLLNMCHAIEQYCRNIPFNYYILLNFYCVAASLFIQVLYMFIPISLTHYFPINVPFYHISEYLKKVLVLLKSMKQLLRKGEEEEKLLKKMTKEKPKSMNIYGKRLELNHLSCSLCFFSRNLKLFDHSQEVLG